MPVINSFVYIFSVLRIKLKKDKRLYEYFFHDVIQPQPYLHHFKLKLYINYYYF